MSGPVLGRFNRCDNLACRGNVGKTSVGFTTSFLHVQIDRIGLRTAASSAVFSGFGPVRLFFVSILEKALVGQKLESNQEVIVATKAYFAVPQKKCFSDGLRKLEHRWVKCIELKWDC